MPLDVISFGSITLDLVISIGDKTSAKFSEEFMTIPLGDKIKADSAELLFGGGASNTSVGFSKLGLKAGICGVLDTQNKKIVIPHFKKHKIQMDGLVFSDHSGLGISSILVAPSGERTIFHHRAESSEFCEKYLFRLPETKYSYIGHLYTCAESILHKLPEWKKNHATKIAWNPGKTQFKKGFKFFEKVFPVIDTLILNVAEAEQFLGMKAKIVSKSQLNSAISGIKISHKNEAVVDDFCDVRDLAKKFLKAGVHTVVLTNGGRGAQVFSGDQHYFIASFANEKVDTLGAGDSFSVGFLSARINGESLQDQMLWGTLCANSVLGEFGAQGGQLDLKALKKLL